MSNPITPEDLTNMPYDEIMRHVSAVRERRMLARQQFEEAAALREDKRREKISKSLDKKIEMLAKELTRLDLLIERIEARAADIRAARLECGLLDLENL